VDNKRCEEKKLNRLWKLQVIIIRPILQKLYSIKVIVQQTTAKDLTKKKFAEMSKKKITIEMKSHLKSVNIIDIS
jgi:hypothetical protein